MTDYAGLVEEARGWSAGESTGPDKVSPIWLLHAMATAIEELQRERDGARAALAKALIDDVKAEAQLARQQEVIEAARVQHEAYGAYHGLKAALSALDPGSETT